MKTITPLQVEPSVRPSRLEVLIQRLDRFGIPPLLISIVLTIGMSATIGKLAVKLSRQYYAVAPYHYDSATYRMQAVRFHESLEAHGIASALVQSLQTKDSLDISLRLVLTPQFLLHPYGHMVVLLPFMSVFIFLVIWYVFTRTNSLLLSLAAVAFLFTFPLMYSPSAAPIVGGIADYEKDNLATWLIGSAVMAWLLSSTLTRRHWSFFCGLFLGLLVMQRAVAAVYAATIFLPLVLWATYQRVRSDGIKLALIRIGSFAIPAALLGSLLIIVQWRQLYNYYFVVGYSYGTPVLVARYLLYGLRNVSVAPFVLVVCGAYLFCLISISLWKQQRGDIIVAGWFVFALPLIISITSAFYFGFYPIWIVLLIVLLATLIPRTLGANISVFALALLLVASTSSAIQYHISFNRARALAESLATTRLFYQDLAHVITAQPEPSNYGLLFDEVDFPFLNQVFSDKGVLLNPTAVFMSIHDSYYRAAFGDLSAQQIADINIRSLEQRTGALAVAYCEPRDILKQPNFLENNRDLLAAHVAIAMNDYLLHSPAWKAIRKLSSPYGCLYVYQHSAQVLSETEKWQSLAFSGR
jgi:hypothetical protein